jgi:hypothetical protein
MTIGPLATGHSSLAALRHIGKRRNDECVHRFSEIFIGSPKFSHSNYRSTFERAPLSRECRQNTATIPIKPAATSTKNKAEFSTRAQT